MKWVKKMEKEVALFKIGEQVHHFEYGGGEVVHANGDLITVAFDEKLSSYIDKETDEYEYVETEKSKFKEVLASELEKITLRVLK
jgi:hypothetical protein